ncbi:hypothetical protein [Pseudomonas sp. MPDS]|nr:hypothetical protein [Pseudomonas sp. MPDS]QKJ37270.1 hypothetical protein HQ912_21515 [Pseudomonas sp. MPDS]
MKIKQVEFSSLILGRYYYFKGGAQQTADEKKPATKSRFFHIPRQNHTA